MAFLEVLTRCYRRPHLLRANIFSLEGQTDGDWDQVLLLDTEGKGVGAAQARLADHAPYVSGEMVWILDDDDMCTRPRLVQEVKAIAGEHHPDVIMVRMDHGNGRVLPDDDHWQQPPTLSYIGCSAYIVKRRLWQRYAPVFGGAKYTSDYDFIDAVFGSDPDIYWHDIIAAKVQRVSMGVPE